MFKHQNLNYLCMNGSRKIIIVFYVLFKVVCEFRYSKGHRIKKKASTILNFFYLCWFNLYFLKLVFLNRKIPLADYFNMLNFNTVLQKPNSVLMRNRRRLSCCNYHAQSLTLMRFLRWKEH